MTLAKPAANYLQKLALYGTITALSIISILLAPWPLKLLPQLFLGAMFAHGVELEHEMIHQRHFGKRWGDAIGFLLGLPMFVEFTRYRITHSYHHRAVGTPDDEESFSYNFGQLGAPLSFALHLSMVNHYGNVLKNVAYAWLGNTAAIRHNMGSAGKKAPPQALQYISRGYRVMGLVIVGAIALSLALDATLFLQIWLIPLLFASPIHALVELPEHWGCNTASTDMMVNTRTIVPSRFADWFTNGNCWHVEHHYKPSMPMNDLPKLHDQIVPKIKFLNLGYKEFYQMFLVAFFEKPQAAESTIKN